MTNPPSTGSSWIRQARQDYQASESSNASITEAQLQALADGSLTGEERLLVADAVIRDPKLAEKVQRLMRQGSAAGVTSEDSLPSSDGSEVIDFKASTNRRSNWRKGLGGFALVAAALLAGLLFVGGWDLLKPSATRGAQQPTLKEQSPVDTAILQSAPEILTWSPVAGAESYSVTLFDSESSVLWSESGILNSEIALPEQVIARLQQPGSYLWRVDSRVDLVSRSSPVWRFQVAP